MRRLMLLLVSVLIIDVLPAYAQSVQPMPFGAPPKEVINELKHFQKKMEVLAEKGYTKRNLEEFSKKYVEIAGTPSAGKAPYAGPPPLGPYSGGVDLSLLLEENLKNAGEVIPHIMGLFSRPFFDSEDKNSCTAHQYVPSQPCIKCVKRSKWTKMCLLYAVTFSVAYRYPVETVETTQNMYDSRMATKVVNKFSRELTYGKGRDVFGAANSLAGGGGIVLPQSLRMNLQLKSDIFKYWVSTSMAAQARSPSADLNLMRDILMKALTKAEFESETWEKTGEFWDAHKHLRGVGGALGGISRSVQTRIAPDLPSRWLYKFAVEKAEPLQFVLYITRFLDVWIDFKPLPLTCHTNLNPKTLKLNTKIPKGMASSDSLFVSSAYADDEIDSEILPMPDPGGFKPAVNVCELMHVRRDSPLSILCDIKATDLVRPAGMFEYSQWPMMAVFNNTAKPLVGFRNPFLTLLKKPDLCSRTGGRLPSPPDMGLGALAKAITKGPDRSLSWNEICLGKLPERGSPSTTGFKLGDFASLVPEGPKIPHLYSSISGIMKMEKAVRKDDGDEEDVVEVNKRAFYKADFHRLEESEDKRKFKDLIQVLPWRVPSNRETPDNRRRGSVFKDMKCLGPEEIKDRISEVLEEQGFKMGTFEFASAYKGVLSESSDILNREPGNTFVHWRAMNCCPMKGAMPWDDYVEKERDPFTRLVIRYLNSILGMNGWDQVLE